MEILLQQGGILHIYYVYITCTYYIPRTPKTLWVESTHLLPVSGSIQYIRAHSCRYSLHWRSEDTNSAGDLVHKTSHCRALGITRHLITPTPEDETNMIEMWRLNKIHKGVRFSFTSPPINSAVYLELTADDSFALKPRENHSVFLIPVITQNYSFAAKITDSRKTRRGQPYVICLWSQHQ